MTAISVIIPVYNAAAFLKRAVESAFEASGSAFSLDVVIVDDGSTDDTPSIALELAGYYAPAVRVVRQQNRGPAAARNHGLSLARADLIAFLDADDQWPVDKLQIQSAWLEAHPTHDFVLGRIQYIGSPDILMPDYPFEGPDNTMTNVQLGSGLYRRQAFDRIGLFDETMRVSDDADWVLRALETDAEFTILKATTLLYFLHSASLTFGKNMREREAFLALKKSLERRRAKRLTNGAIPALQKWSDHDQSKLTDE